MKKQSNEVTVGAFVIVGMIALTVIVFFVSGVYLFRPGYSLTVVYDYVSILDKGAPVRMAGVRIGEVQNVQLDYDQASGRSLVKVKLFIEKGIEIRQNYLFYIRGTHVLSEPHIEISPQPGNEAVLEPDATVTGIDPTPLEALIGHAHHISEQLDNMITDLKEAMEDQESRDALKHIVLNLARLTESLDMILSGSEEEVKQAIRNISSSTESLSSILDAVENGEGTAGRLLMEDELYQEMRAFVSEIKARPWRLMKKEGDGGKFLWIF